MLATFFLDICCRRKLLVEWEWDTSEPGRGRERKSASESREGGGGGEKKNEMRYFWQMKIDKVEGGWSETTGRARGNIEVMCKESSPDQDFRPSRLDAHAPTPPPLVHSTPPHTPSPWTRRNVQHSSVRSVSVEKAFFILFLQTYFFIGLSWIWIAELFPKDINLLLYKFYDERVTLFKRNYVCVLW